MKKIFILLVCLTICFQMIGCVGTGGTNQNSKDKGKINDFYEKVSESQKLLDQVADDVYSYWYDAIYKDKYAGNIDIAIAMALAANSSNVDKIEELDVQIGDLFKEVKESEYGNIVKDIMSAYSDYYEFVINVSGSFKSYSEKKETLKKELASLLRDLSYEL